MLYLIIDFCFLLFFVKLGAPGSGSYSGSRSSICFANNHRPHHPILLPPHSLGPHSGRADGWGCGISTPRGQVCTLEGEVDGSIQPQKADRLLDLAGLGDCKPSQLCAHIQSLTVDQNTLLRHVFLCQLPEGVRVQVSTLDDTDLSALACKADVIMAAKRTSPFINASNQPSQPRKKAPSRNSTLCWYHAKFGYKAKTCRPPCSFVEGDPVFPGNRQAST